MGKTFSFLGWRERGPIYEKIVGPWPYVVQLSLSDLAFDFKNTYSVLSFPTIIEFRNFESTLLNENHFSTFKRITWCIDGNKPDCVICVRRKFPYSVKNGVGWNEKFE